MSEGQVHDTVDGGDVSPLLCCGTDNGMFGC